MPIEKYTPDTRTTINWTSGTSTEIFIYPENGSFTKRDFLFRISTATVEAEESNFTFFEGTTRHLMLLKGELELIHEGRYTKHLKPFDQDTFSGEWTTRSRGKVTDFNLMLKSGANGSLRHHTVGSRSKKTFKATTEFYFLYFASGDVSLDHGNLAKAGDLIRLKTNDTINVEAQGGCDVIEIEVSLSS